MDVKTPGFGYFLLLFYGTVAFGRRARPVDGSPFSSRSLSSHQRPGGRLTCQDQWRFALDVGMLHVMQRPFRYRVSLFPASGKPTELKRRQIFWYLLLLAILIPHVSHSMKRQFVADARTLPPRGH